MGSQALAMRDDLADTAEAEGAGGRHAAGPAAGPSAVRLTLTDFRCYDHLRLEAGDGTVVLAGPNGAGKTNVLEALSFLVPGRGLRRARLTDVIRRGPGEADGPVPDGRGWAAAARVHTADGVVEIGTGLVTAEGEKRAVHVDGQPARSQAALSDHLNAVWLTPQMDRLFVEGAPARRRFLDRLVFGLDQAHAGRVRAYDHAMRERARLLRTHGRDADPAWLGALEDTMAAKGVAVAAARREAAGRLAAVCATSTGPFPGAAVAVSGAVESWLDDGPALVVEDRLRDSLAASRRGDAETGSTAVGAHRSDVQVRHLAKGLPAEQCSTGEQKALLIALVLAGARLQAAERGSVPILLLDEVAAHLDPGRREALFDHVEATGAQAWYTGTEAGLFAPLRARARFFHVEDAVVTPRD